MDRKKLAFALGFLAIATLVALRGLMSVLEGPPPPPTPPSAEQARTEDPGAAAALDEPAGHEDTGHLTADLVALHGSFETDAPVHDAFGLLAPAAATDGTPASSSGASSDPTAAWPRHHVSLVLLAGERHSAVIDQAVVGVGETIAAGRVLSIAEETVRVEADDGGVLVYALATEAIDPVIEERTHPELEGTQAQTEAQRDDQ